MQSGCENPIENEKIEIKKEPLDEGYPDEKQNHVDDPNEKSNVYDDTEEIPEESMNAKDGLCHMAKNGECNDLEKDVTKIKQEIKSEGESEEEEPEIKVSKELEY